MPDEPRPITVRDWPATMRRATAAAYLDLPATAFDRAVAEGTLPLPFKIAKREVWARATLDASVGVLAGSSRGDWRSRQPAYEDD